MHRVLLVDNEPWILESLSKRIAWAEAGCEVVATALSAQAALDGLAGWRPDIVCTDIRMPGMDGLDFLSALKDRSGDIEVILVTGHADFEYARTAVNRGASGFCLKPVDRTEMLGILRQTVARLDSRTRQDSDRHDRKPAGAGLAPGLPLVPVVLRTAGSEPPSLPHVRTEFFPLDDHTWVAGFEPEALRRLELETPSWPGTYRVSDVVLGPPCRDPGALEEALTVLHGLAYTSFLTGHPSVIRWDDRGRDRPLDVLKGLNTALERTDWASVRTLLTTLREGFESARYPASDLLLLENQIRLSLALHTSVVDPLVKAPRTFQSLAEEFATASDLIEALELRLAEDRETIGRSLAAGSSHPVVREVVGHLNRRYMEPLTLEDLADLVGVSAGHLGKLFIKECGMSVGDFLAGIRIEHAKVLLEKSRDSIEDIGLRCGYGDYYYFCKVFKKVTGSPPGTWRHRRKVPLE